MPTPGAASQLVAEPEGPADTALVMHITVLPLSSLHPRICAGAREEKVFFLLKGITYVSITYLFKSILTKGTLISFPPALGESAGGNLS